MLWFCVTERPETCQAALVDFYRGVPLACGVARFGVPIIKTTLSSDGAGGAGAKVRMVRVVQEQWCIWCGRNGAYQVRVRLVHMVHAEGAGA